MLTAIEELTSDIEMQSLKEQLQYDLQPLSAATQDYSSLTESYFDHYGLNYPDTEHYFGWFESGGLKLAGHIWTPCRGSENLVIALHGYMNHTGQFKHLSAALLENGHAVGTFDLPGHGLSQGKEAAINQFHNYTMILRDFILLIRRMHPMPIHLIGFSTGSGIAIDYLTSGRQDDTEKAVLASPLVRWHAYHASKITYAFYRTFTDQITRIPQRNSSDRDFLYFNKYEDYLHCRHLSLDWARAVFRWNEAFKQAPICKKDVLILQGNRDTTVDWRYNIPLLRSKFPRATVKMIPGAGHELFNEAPEYRNIAIEHIVQYLT